MVKTTATTDQRIPEHFGLSALSVRKQGEIETYYNDDPVQGNLSHSALEHFDRILARVRWHKKSTNPSVHGSIDSRFISVLWFSVRKHGEIKTFSRSKV